MLTSLINLQIEKPVGSCSQISSLLFSPFFLLPLLPPYYFIGFEKLICCFCVLFVLININLKMTFQYHQINFFLVKQLWFFKLCLDLYVLHFFFFIVHICSFSNNTCSCFVVCCHCIVTHSSTLIVFLMIILYYFLDLSTKWWTFNCCYNSNNCKKFFFSIVLGIGLLQATCYCFDKPL